MTPTDQRAPSRRDLLLFGAFSAVATVAALGITLLMDWHWCVFIPIVLVAEWAYSRVFPGVRWSLW